jgi:hypothetical protein
VFGELPETAYLGKEMPVVEIGDFAAEGVEVRLTFHECALKPAWEWFVGFVSIVIGKCVEVGAERGVRWPVAIGVPCNVSVVELFDPFGRACESCVVWYEKAWGATVVLFVAVRGCFEGALIMVNLLFELSDTDVSSVLHGELVELPLMDGGNEPASDVLQHDSIEGLWVVKNGEDSIRG